MIYDFGIIAEHRCNKKSSIVSSGGAITTEYGFVFSHHSFSRVMQTSPFALASVAFESLGKMLPQSTPEVFKPPRRHFGVPDRMLDILMTQVRLQRSRVVPLVGQGVAAGVPQHVRFFAGESTPTGKIFVIIRRISQQRLASKLSQASGFSHLRSRDPSLH